MGGCSSKDKVHEPNKAYITSFKTADEMTDFNTLFIPSSNSLLKQALTEDVWNEYKDQKCSCGVSFKTCIFSGVKNQDSGVGVYAGSHDSYKKFNKLFDPVIEKYHGHKQSDKHVIGMYSEGLQNAELSADDAKMIVSTRIRVGRNLAGFPLGPGVSKEQRLEIMNKVVEAAKSFEGDLKGTFYPLEGMNDKDRQKLVDDHFLFK
jgi:hypothetical protein